jgi:transcriptional regulator with XRE-family HTH domain
MSRAMGLTQEEFAALLKMTWRQIAELEGGRANPTLDTLERIGRLFGLTTGFVPISAVNQPPRGERGMPTWRHACERSWTGNDRSSLGH